MSDANVVKFSNDGRLMLLTTTDGHIHVLDSFRGTLVSSFLRNCFFPLFELMDMRCIVVFLIWFCCHCCLVIHLQCKARVKHCYIRGFF